MQRTIEFVNPLHTAVDHLTIDDHLNLHIINTKRQRAGIHFVVTHREILYAEQAAIT
ncbi:hypothetical protein D3C71_2099980 [compost metagenome]